MKPFDFDREGMTEEGRLGELLRQFVVEDELLFDARRLRGITAAAGNELVELLPSSLTDVGVEAAPSLREAVAGVETITGATLDGIWIPPGRPDESVFITGVTVPTEADVPTVLSTFGPLVGGVDGSGTERHPDGTCTVWYVL